MPMRASAAPTESETVAPTTTKNIALIRPNQAIDTDERDVRHELGTMCME